MTMGFFDNFSRFLSTSQTSPVPARLNARHAAIIGQHRGELAGMRVLDIASHDGRWSFAALQAGAAHVTGIEPRPELIEAARQTFAHYGVAEARYEFIVGDVFDVLSRQDAQFDVVLCLGFFYHTIRHCELFDLIARTGARWLVVDTEVALPSASASNAFGVADTRRPTDGSLVIQLLTDPVEDQSMACPDRLTRGGKTLVGRPSREAVRFMAEHFGYEAQEFDWTDFFRRRPEDADSLRDYAEGWRTTLYCRLRDA